MHVEIERRAWRALICQRSGHAGLHVKRRMLQLVAVDFIDRMRTWTDQGSFRRAAHSTVRKFVEAVRRRNGRKCVILGGRSPSLKMVLPADAAA